MTSSEAKALSRGTTIPLRRHMTSSEAKALSQGTASPLWRHKPSSEAQALFGGTRPLRRHNSLRGALSGGMTQNRILERKAFSGSTVQLSKEGLTCSSQKVPPKKVETLQNSFRKV